MALGDTSFHTHFALVTGFRMAFGLAGGVAWTRGCLAIIKSLFARAANLALVRLLNLLLCRGDGSGVVLRRSPRKGCTYFPRNYAFEIGRIQLRLAVKPAGWIRPVSLPLERMRSSAVKSNSLPDNPAMRYACLRLIKKSPVPRSKQCSVSFPTLLNLEIIFQVINCIKNKLL